MKIYCCTENRRRLIETTTALNGIDYLEVVPTAIVSDAQKVLEIHFLRPMETPIEIDQVFLTVENTLSSIEVLEITEATDGSSIQIRLSDHGDFSLYTLHLMESWEEQEFLLGFDKPLSAIDFSFKVACPSFIDCKPADLYCDDVSKDSTPEINYLAKDYTSFKQLLLDRMSFLVPDWKERNPTDLGVTLVEILAYVGDYLSYRQDAVTTEAYLRTSRKRISVRRHARLIDYYMHDGLNARTWVYLEVDGSSDGTFLQHIDNNGFVAKFIIGEPNSDDVHITPEQFLTLDRTPLVFEPMHDVQLFSEHNVMSFHNYGERSCCLPKGTTQATLVGRYDNLKRNDVLIFEEVRSPKTGAMADANPEHRHAIKLKDITFDTDFDFSENPAQEIDITIITWAEEDALPFSLCTSGVLNMEERRAVFEVSVARGNVVLADHGLTVSDKEGLREGFSFETVTGSLLPTLVPESTYHFASQGHSTHCTTATTMPVPARYNPKLKMAPLTQSQPLLFEEPDAADLEIAASGLTKQDIRAAVPAIHLKEVVETGDSFEVLDGRWEACKDLLVDSSVLDKHFVVEIDSNGVAQIRFGNDLNGKAPDAGSKFLANYRIGNGSSGNVGRDTLNILVHNPSINIISIRNLLPAQGGKSPETKEEVKQYAPQAFRTQERAVITSDYEDVAKRCKDDIQSVAAKFRWTGSWQTTFITADRLEAKKVTPEWEQELRECLEKYRLAGVDVHVEEPKYVGLELAIDVCIKPEFFKIDLYRDISRLLSNRNYNGRKRGFFHPDNLVFGQTLYLSQLYAIVQAVEGVISVDVRVFGRYGVQGSSGIASGKIAFGKNEIPRLDNDPNFIDRGILELNIKGGR